MKIFQLLSNPAVEFIKKASTSKLESFEDSLALAIFAKKHEEVIQEARKVFEPIRHKVDAKDEETVKSWTAYLNQDVELKKLPISILKCIPETTAEHILCLESLFDIVL